METNEKLPADQQAKAIVQLVIFRIENEEFGIPIDMVREIIKLGTVTPIPNSPDFIKGIINVRGEIVTALDMKYRFTLAPSIFAEPKHVIVSKQGDNLFGLIVDEVIEIIRIFKNNIQPSPSIININQKKYVSGVITHQDRLIILLDLARLLSEEELIQLENLNIPQPTNKKNNALNKKSSSKKNNSSDNEDST